MESRTATGLRRSGLPRVSGGAPWPPPRAGAALLAGPASPAQADAGTVVLATPAQPLTQAQAQGTTQTQTPAPTQTQAPAAVSATGSVPGAATGLATGSVAGAVTASVPPAQAAELGVDAILQRRGLPRTVGGDAWPPPRAVPVIAVAAVTPVVAVAPLDDSATVVGSESASTVASSVTAAASAPTAVASVEKPTERLAASSGQAEDPGPAQPAEPSQLPGPAQPPAPELRRYRGRTLRQWTGIGVLAGAAVLLFGALAMLFTRWLLGTQPLQDFLAHYPGESRLPDGAPVGVPWWLSWAHFFNVFLILLIIRSGLQTRAEKRPTVFWTPRWNPKRKISLTIWFHQALDLLWFLNGVVFVVLLFATGQWVRIVPTSWDVFPNAISAGLQYVSLDWPTENGWVNYNGLQQLAYFGTVFLAAPLAAATGVRMSGLWPKGATRLNKIYPIEVARAVHFPVMLYFVVFIAFHITLVLATGALRNLNHMYAGQDVVNWTGLGIFAVSLLVIAGGVFAARPLVIAPIASLFGRVGR